MDSESTNLTLPSDLSDEDSLKLASAIALQNLVFAQEELGRRIVDPTITTKGLLDIAEHSFKVSGMAKRQEVKEQAGTGFSIVINFPDGSNGKLEKVVNETPTPAQTIKSLVEEARPLIDWSNTPEFTDAATN